MRTRGEPDAAPAPLVKWADLRTGLLPEVNHAVQEARVTDGDVQPIVAVAQERASLGAEVLDATRSSVVRHRPEVCDGFLQHINIIGVKSRHGEPSLKGAGVFITGKRSHGDTGDERD